jgi:hypothetical protein
MDFETLFGIYYNLYRGEATPPGTTDDEWKIAARNYNAALLRMSTYDDVKWNFMWGTAQTASTGTHVLATADTTYTAPTDMQEPGGILTYIDTNSNRLNYQIVQPHQVQTLEQLSTYGYFTGNSQTGFTLNVNPSPSSTQNGWGIDYDYYKKPTLLDPDTEAGTSLLPGGDPMFYVNFMLSMRYRNTRNYPSYSTALRDAEEALKLMKIKNNSGSYFNSWGVSDSGPGFGV